MEKKKKIPACVDCVFPILLIPPTPSLRGFYILNQSLFLKKQDHLVYHLCFLSSFPEKYSF